MLLKAAVKAIMTLVCLSFPTQSTIKATSLLSQIAAQMLIIMCIPVFLYEITHSTPQWDCQWERWQPNWSTSKFNNNSKQILMIIFIANHPALLCHLSYFFCTGHWECVLFTKSWRLLYKETQWWCRLLDLLGNRVSNKVLWLSRRNVSYLSWPTVGYLWLLRPTRPSLVHCCQLWT